MKEGIEKLNTKEEEKTTIDKLLDIRNEELKNKDIINPTIWGGIDIEKLIPEVMGLFESIEDGKPKVAFSSIEGIREKIKGIKDEDKRKSNKAFLTWIDDKISLAFGDNILNDFKEKND